jgi:hypothetical protein
MKNLSQFFSVKKSNLPNERFLDFFKTSTNKFRFVNKRLEFKIYAPKEVLRRAHNMLKFIKIINSAKFKKNLFIIIFKVSQNATPKLWKTILQIFDFRLKKILCLRTIDQSNLPKKIAQKCSTYEIRLRYRNDYLSDFDFRR